MAERISVPVEGGWLEVLRLGGRGAAGKGPVIVETHPHRPAEPDPVAERIASFGTLLRVSPRGLGGSSPALESRDLSLERLVLDLEQVRRHLDLRRWVPLGFSLGAAVAMLYALRHPEAVSGLILTFMGPGAQYLADPDCIYSPLHSSWRAQVESLPRGEGRRWVKAGDSLSVLFDGERPLLCLPVPEVPERIRVQSEEWVGADLTERLGALEMPALVVGGRRDEAMPARHAEALARALPRAELLLLDRSGHGVSEQELLLFTAAVDWFLTHAAR
jgi:pimeloyl-ACP methyl ester carboxylesterase